ncbi:alpha-mannosidase [Clostridium oryzae]|uniref:Mannosylglycerate hydrolase n=1 Tax=Clostridium oryzae TaxID=1450648 RepID=A0A1V4IMF0_9CLOT|nr:alpha-mannosidase [Clostridium oryzae]OPJ61191.1 mannosylglycerate hydrolase [Clostridium oryzae]
MYFEIERIKRILRELKDGIYTNKLPILDVRRKECNYGQYELLNEDSSTWERHNAGDRWGGKDKHCWFKLKAEIPEEFDGKAVTFEISTGAEQGWDAVNPQFLIYYDGKVIQGLDVNHREIMLNEKAAAGEIYELASYSYSGMGEKKIEFNPAISIYHKDVEKLYYHIKVPLEVAELLQDQDKRRFDILNYLTQAVNLIDLRQSMSETYYSSIHEATEYLDREFYNEYCHDEGIYETCVGHTHIDVAWLWTIAQTREKTARSFSTVLSLMKQYPNYIFMSSQPQLYQFLKEDHPDVYEQVKARVKEGRWETEGAMWLEADCNLTSGESLVRQIVYGKRFFKEEFGVDSKILWLPDVFGYSAALPQILKKSGVKYFMTTKISWNEYNMMPYDTFLWRGIDGTEVFTHFITTRDYEKSGEVKTGTTYNGNTNPSSVMGCWQRYQHKDMNNEVLNCFGYGDGGGGATREMLENIERLEKGIPGAPKVKLGTALDYFTRLEERVANHKHMPKWVGELYLEYHRGTYTSNARNKKFNRKTEFMNIDAELFSTINKVFDNNYLYPDKTLKKCWETALLNQFHDIIPGSSIRQVYEDSKKDYERIQGLGKEIIQSATSTLAAKMKLDKASVVVFNQLGYDRDDIVIVALPDDWKGAKIFDNGRELPVQITAKGEIIFFAENVPSKGYKAFEICEANGCDEYISTGEISESRIINQYFDIELDNKANIVSIFDKVNNRQVLKEGQRANVIQAFEDKPHNYDAWDINIYYSEKMWEIDDVTDIKVVENGPVRQGLQITRKFLDSKLIQTIYVYNNIPRIDFSNWIDWKEKQILVKAAFPVDVLANKATYEIQYGNVERPTHWNTSWDYARFEVCAHKWADISEDGYGVSLLNDCKYGHDIKDSVMRLTMLKSAVEPNENADREVHEFTYSLYPHAGSFKDGKVVQMAYDLNCPLYAVIEKPHDGVLQSENSFVKLDKENVIIEVVKKAESSDDIIIRVYECYNRRVKVNCSVMKDIVSVEECDLLENEIENLKFNRNSFSFEIKPYEIKTFKLRLS